MVLDVVEVELIFMPLYSYGCLFIFLDADPNEMDIEETGSTDCYGLFFFYPYDVLKLMGVED